MGQAPLAQARAAPRARRGGRRARSPGRRRRRPAHFATSMRRIVLHGASRRAIASGSGVTLHSWKRVTLSCSRSAAKAIRIGRSAGRATLTRTQRSSKLRGGVRAWRSSSARPAVVAAKIVRSGWRDAGESAAGACGAISPSAWRRSRWRYTVERPGRSWSGKRPALDLGVQGVPVRGLAGHEAQDGVSCRFCQRDPRSETRIYLARSSDIQCCVQIVIQLVRSCL